MTRCWGLVKRLFVWRSKIWSRRFWLNSLNINYCFQLCKAFILPSCQGNDKMSQIYLKQMYCVPLLCIGSWNPMYQGQRIWSHLSVSYRWPAPCSRTRREALGLQLASLLIWSSQPAYAANGSEGKKSTRELRDIIVQDFQTRQCKT